MNKVILTGYLGKEPTLRKGAASVSIATTERTKNGEITDWHSVVFFNKLGDIAADHLHKGSLVTVVGQLKHGKYTNGEGKTIYTTYVVARELEMLGAKKTVGDVPPEHQEQQQNADFEDDDLPI